MTWEIVTAAAIRPGDRVATCKLCRIDATTGRMVSAIDLGSFEAVVSVERVTTAHRDVITIRTRGVLLAGLHAEAEVWREVPADKPRPRYRRRGDVLRVAFRRKR